MKHWSNKQHETVLKNKRIKKLEKSILTYPHYDTSDFKLTNKNKELSTQTKIGNI